MSWPEAHPDTTLDADTPEHVKWVYERAKQRADQYRIEGVTYRCVKNGVVRDEGNKHIHRKAAHVH